MALIPVDSSAIRAIGWEGGVLGVLFHTSDTVYTFPGVPYELFARFLNSSSPGTFYTQYIRGRFE